jgi:hypothetical protein
MLPLVLGAAEVTAAGLYALASRQMDATVVAADHVLPGNGFLWISAAIDAFAIGLQQPVDQYDYENEENDFRQTPAPV